MLEHLHDGQNGQNGMSPAAPVQPPFIEAIQFNK